MEAFDKILNWRLKAGSHKFPGPAGGTCINEAAIVAAGFEYKKVTSYKDCPPCFCPVLSQAAIAVNDYLPNGERQRLLRLVTRLAGSKDARAHIERARARYFVAEMLERTRALYLVLGRVPEAQGPIRVFEVSTPVWPGLTHHRDDIDWVKDNISTDPARAVMRFNAALCHLGGLLHHRPLRTREPPPHLVPREIRRATETAAHFEGVTVWHEATLWRHAAEVLFEAFDIGVQAEPIATALVEQRFEAIKELARARG